MACLPEIRPTTGSFGTTTDVVTICVSVVDQSAALFGHHSFAPDTLKITFGTGAFALCLVDPLRSKSDLGGLLQTMAWQLGDAKPVRALDGGVHCAAAAVDWARREGLFSEFGNISTFATPSAISRGIVCVPAFTGLGAPYWDDTAVGMFLGIALNTTRPDMCQAVIEGVALRSAQVVVAMRAVTGTNTAISIDGGLSQNAYLRQFLADATGSEVLVAPTTDATALGTALLARLGGENAHDKVNLVHTSKAPFRHLPRNPLTPADHQRFADAVSRTIGWRQAETTDRPVVTSTDAG